MTYLPFQRAAAFILALCFLMPLLGCGKPGDSLTEAEGRAISEICGVAASEFDDISGDALGGGLADRFPAAYRVLRSGDTYAFILKPVAYNGPVTLVLAIDGASGLSIGLRIVAHSETQHYVRDMESAWFTERFAGKPAGEYLRMARLVAENDQDIVAITGATVTTEGIVNGVNAAFGVFQEYVLGRSAADVPYMVRFDPGDGAGPEETGRLTIRAHGRVLGEIDLETIRALPSVKRTMSIRTSTGTTQHSFGGVLLSQILEQLDPGLIDEYDWVLTVGVDDYISGIAMEEVRAENNVFVMYEDNGLPLQKMNGEPGSMRIIVQDDVFGQRFTNYLLEIVLENEDAGK